MPSIFSASPDPPASRLYLLLLYSASSEAFPLQGGDDPADVLAVAGLQHEVQLRVLHRERGEGALVVDLGDIGALGRDDGRDLGKRARDVADLDRHAREAPGPDHA